MSTPETVVKSNETPAPAPALDANGKAMLLSAISQLDMLVLAFANSPERVKKAAKEFRDSLKEWSNA